MPTKRKKVLGKRGKRVLDTRDLETRQSEEDDYAGIEEATKSHRNSQLPRTLKKKILVNRFQLADALGITTGQLSAAVENDQIKRVSVGKYDLVMCVKAWITHIQKIKELTPSKVKDIEQARLTKIRADKEQLLYEELDKNLIRIADVELAWGKIFVAIRQAILSLPGQINFALRDAKPAERSEIVDEALRKVLEAMSSGPVYQQEFSTDDQEFEDSVERNRRAS